MQIRPNTTWQFTGLLFSPVIEAINHTYFIFRLQSDGSTCYVVSLYDTVQAYLSLLESVFPSPSRIFASSCVHSVQRPVPLGCHVMLFTGIFQLLKNRTHLEMFRYGNRILPGTYTTTTTASSTEVEWFYRVTDCRWYFGSDFTAGCRPCYSVEGCVDSLPMWLYNWPCLLKLVTVEYPRNSNASSSPSRRSARYLRRRTHRGRLLNFDCGHEDVMKQDI